MKSKKDICVVVQARLQSVRIPGKMIRPFAGSTLVDILFEKLKKSKTIPQENIYFSVRDDELKEIGKRHNINIFERSQESVMSEAQRIQEIFEWHDKLSYKYVIIISACNPLMTIDTIDSFIDTFLKSDKENCFGVFEKKTYYWDAEHQSLTNWKGRTSMNTKILDPIYEAAHCLYASRMDIIADGYWMNTETPPNLELFIVEELESFDIDYEWQFKVAEKLYKELIIENDNREENYH